AATGPVMSHHMTPEQAYVSPSPHPSTPPEGPTSGLSTTHAQSSSTLRVSPPLTNPFSPSGTAAITTSSGTAPEQYERNHQLPPAMRMRIKELRNEGLGIKRISKALKIPKTTVQGILKHLKSTGGD